MNKALAFARLDFITVKPYLTVKNFIIIMTIPFIVMVSSGDSNPAVGVFIILAALYTSYPFAICEKNGMDALYSTLSITRRTVVLGRYLYALALNVAAGITGLVFAFIMPVVMQKTVSIPETLMVALVMFIIVSIIEAVQLPLYFKLGYEKAKLMAYLPFMGLFLGGLALKPVLAGDMPEQLGSLLGWLAMNPYWTALFGFSIWLGVIILSYQMSAAYYGKRDF